MTAPTAAAAALAERRRHTVSAKSRLMVSGQGERVWDFQLARSRWAAATRRSVVTTAVSAWLWRRSRAMGMALVHVAAGSGCLVAVLEIGLRSALRGLASRC